MGRVHILCYGGLFNVDGLAKNARYRTEGHGLSNLYQKMKVFVEFLLKIFNDNSSSYQYYQSKVGTGWF